MNWTNVSFHLKLKRQGQIGQFITPKSFTKYPKTETHLKNQDNGIRSTQILMAHFAQRAHYPLSRRRGMESCCLSLAVVLVQGSSTEKRWLFKLYHIWFCMMMASRLFWIPLRSRSGTISFNNGSKLTWRAKTPSICLAWVRTSRDPSASILVPLVNTTIYE